MPSDIIFPDPELADEEGLLAYGGNLEVGTLLHAYSLGIFPWYNDDTPILWWSPDPRMVLFPDKFRLSKSLNQKIRKKVFTVKFDTCFAKVIKSCAVVPRKNLSGTWINAKMQKAYLRLHEAGYAHSAEIFYNGKLAGGLYGISIGKVFFGESMFHLVTDASKVALYFLVNRLKRLDFAFIDVQQSTQHLRSLGAEEIPRKEFIVLLKQAIRAKTIKGKWNEPD